MHNSKSKAAEAMDVVNEVVDEAKRYQCAASMHHIWIVGLGRDPIPNAMDYRKSNERGRIFGS